MHPKEVDRQHQLSLVSLGRVTSWETTIDRSIATGSAYRSHAHRLALFFDHPLSTLERWTETPDHIYTSHETSWS